MSDQNPWWKTSIATLTAGAVILIIIVLNKPDENLVYFIAGSAATYLWGKTQGG